MCICLGQFSVADESTFGALVGISNSRTVYVGLPANEIVYV